MKYKLTKEDKDFRIHKKELTKLRKEVQKILKGYTFETKKVDSIAKILNQVDSFYYKSIPLTTYRDSNKDTITPKSLAIWLQTGICSNGYSDKVGKARHYVIQYEYTGLIKPYRCRRIDVGNIQKRYFLSQTLEGVIKEFKDFYENEALIK